VSNLQERVSALERELEHARETMKDQRNDSTAGRILLDSKILHSFTDLLDKCHRFNSRVHKIAKFLSQCLIYKPHKDPLGELNQHFLICQTIVGQRLSEILREQSHVAEPESSNQVPAVFAQIVCMIFLINATVLHIGGNFIDINQKSKFFLVEFPPKLMSIFR